TNSTNLRRASPATHSIKIKGNESRRGAEAAEEKASNCRFQDRIPLLDRSFASRFRVYFSAPSAPLRENLPKLADIERSVISNCCKLTCVIQFEESSG